MSGPRIPAARWLTLGLAFAIVVSLLAPVATTYASTDLTPGDAFEQRVTGDDRPVRFVGENGIRYAGNGVRFRIVGGEFRIVIAGAGIDLSAVGRGFGFIQGAGGSPGLYSIDGADCRTDAASCKPLPDFGRRFQLAGPERDKDGAGRTP